MEAFNQRVKWGILIILPLIISLVAFILVNPSSELRIFSNQEVAGASSFSTAAITSEALKNVYFTFTTFRYGKYATPSQLYQGDMLYLKNFDRSKLRLLQIFLYDYQKKGNQEYIKSRVTPTSMYVRTRYKLPSGLRLAYVAKFQDIRTGEITTKYFTLFPPIDSTKPWTVAPNCPVSTLDCVPCTNGADCRFEPGKSYGFKGWACQDNNPGNIRPGTDLNMSTNSKNKMIIKNGGVAACGVRYDSRGGNYLVFATYSAGYEALKAYIKGINNGEHSSYAGTGWKCGNCTLTQFFGVYSPDSSGNNTYANAVALAIGEPTTQTLNYIVANKLTAFVDAIKEHEGFITK